MDGQAILELDGSMNNQPAEIEGAAVASATSHGSAQNPTIVPRNDQESPLLQEAIHENKGRQTRNISGRRSSPGRETKPRAEMDEIKRLEEEEQRIEEVIADAERLNRLRSGRLAIQDRIKKAKERSTTGQ